MKLQVVTLAALLVSVNAPIGLAQTPATSAYEPKRTYRIEINPRLESLHTQYRHVAEASCHVSRAALFNQALKQAGPDGFKRPDSRANLTALLRQMPRAERKEAARLRLIEANYRKYQERSALKEARRTESLERRMMVAQIP
jgi:hypothetical protein